MIRPLRNHIVFAFYDEVTSKGTFRSTTESGIIVVNNTEAAKEARWGKVLAIGPEVESDITVGTDILIEPLMWTLGVDVDGVRIWRTDSSKVLAVRE